MNIYVYFILFFVRDLCGAQEREREKPGGEKRGAKSPV